MRARAHTHTHTHTHQTLGLQQRVLIVVPIVFSSAPKIGHTNSIRNIKDIGGKCQLRQAFSDSLHFGTTQAHNVRAYLRLADVLGLYDARVPREILVCVRV